MEKIILVAIGAVAIAAVLVSGLIIFAPPQTPQCTVATGPIVSKTVPLESFTKIEVSGQIELYLKQDDLESVSIEAQESIAGLVFAETQNSTLKVGLMDFGLPGAGRPCINGQTKIKVFVSAASIDSIKAGDFAKVFTEGRLHQERLFLKASGSALIDANVSVDDLNSFASGFGTIILAGFAERHSANAITGGKIIADKLETTYGFFEASDSGSIDATVFEEVSAVATTGGSIGFGGGAIISGRVTESGGTITEIPDSGGNEGDSGTEGGTVTGDEGGEESGADEGLPDEETPQTGGGDEEPEQAVCGNSSIEALEECELDTDCAADEECSGCECILLPDGSDVGPISPEECAANGGTATCAESPACPFGMRSAGNIEGTEPPCICCVPELK